MRLGQHVCGLYFNQDRKRIYLPQVELRSHTTITPVCFTTKLTQTFDNPNDATLQQVRYTFPLYDGVAVSGYTITFGEKTIRGVVQQKDQAKKTYQAAVDRGETAGLLESLPAGVFGVTLGNVPAKASIVVDITYCGELKHDAAIDGLRYTLPTSIAPRYGSYPGQVLQSNVTSNGGISIAVDVDMASSAIRKVQSPSHPIALSMGALSTTEGGDNAPFAPSQASATLTRGTTELGDDFVLQLLIDDISRPQAILETHPTFPHQRALMTTLVPKFTLDSAHPEIVFIADQSGSMSGSKNAALVKALKVFLKSLPLGVRFNICAFGNDFRFLFPKSQAYNEDNLKAALSFVESFRADYGGTEILKPITAAFEQHLSDLLLEIMLLTDGEIWAEDAVFQYINQQVAEKRVDARVFALGIGRDVSHTLVEGVARAGRGFAQFVTQEEEEETDQKVMRMLKGALYAHTRDYEVEVHYVHEKDEEKMGDVDEDEEFEIVEKVNDCLSMVDQAAKTAPLDNGDGSNAKPISFFDTSTDLDRPANTDNDTTDRYAHLLALQPPKLLQAPNTIPPLFPFNRTTLYLLLGPETTQKPVNAITLRAKSAQGPLELNIPVHHTAPTSTGNVPVIHQLAARKATQDLEEGRGWLSSATVDGAAVREKFPGRFDELVERECVRLGERFQVAGRWTAFVAVEGGAEGKVVEDRESLDGSGGGGAPRKRTGGAPVRRQLASYAARRYVNSPPRGGGGGGGVAGAFGSGAGFGNATATLRGQGRGVSPFTFGSATATAASPSRDRYQDTVLLTNDRRSAPTASPSPATLANSPSFSGTTAVFGASASVASAAYAVAPPSPSYSPTDPAGPQLKESEDSDLEDEEMGFGLFDDDDVPFVGAPALQGSSVDDATLAQYQREMESAACMPLPDGGDPDLDGDMGTAAAEEFAVGKKKAAKISSSRSSATSTAATTTAEDTKRMTSLIDLQTFSGAWAWTPALLSLLGTSSSESDVKALFSSEGIDDETVIATTLAIAFFEKRLPGKREVWEMVVLKARGWLGRALGRGVDDVGRVVERVKTIL